MNVNPLHRSSLDLLASVWRHLSRRRRIQFGLLMGLTLVSSLAEVVSLGAVLPFLGILVAPERVLNHPIFDYVAQAWGITYADRLVLPLTVAFASAAIIAGAIRILLLWASTRLAFAAGADLSLEVYRRTLYQPYWVHLAQNSSEVISGITDKVSNVVGGVLLPSLILLSSTLILLAIMLVLIVIDPMVALLSTVIFGVGYASIAWLTHRRLHRNSQLIAYEQTQVVKALQEGLGGIRDVLLDGTQDVYCEIYRQADRQLRYAQGNNNFFNGSPRYFMEALGMVLIAVLAYVLSLQAGGISLALPALGALALGAQRLLPALQQGYSSWASIASSYGSLAALIELLEQPLMTELQLPTPTPLRLQGAIRLEKVGFRYTSEGPWVLQGLNLTIPKGARIAFIGRTGSGKSTTMDLLMGLLMPTQGELLVDEQSIRGERVRAWQQTIAHVPQSIYLSDATLAENIAFGVSHDEIDPERVRRAARQAQIADFIESIPEGYQTTVGERGIRLSGGQRQRIGIARALYKDASVLVFDEATSALDNDTEESVMNSINGLNRDLTILLVAHRLSSIRRCDIIVELEHGRIASQGTFDQILASSPSFRQLTGHVEGDHEIKKHD